MEKFITIDLILRWAHLVFGITWIGLLYYFNFIQGEYFKEAEAPAKADALKKLAPRALWWFRWGAMFTAITGGVLLVGTYQVQGIDSYIIIGALMGTLMFLNVWLIIWPAQKIVCGITPGDAKLAGPKGLLASRTNTLFSVPMLLGMLGSSHGLGQAGNIVAHSSGTGSMSIGLWISILLILALQANAMFGKLGPIEKVKGVIHSSIALAVVFLLLIQFV